MLCDSPCFVGAVGEQQARQWVWQADRRKFADRGQHRRTDVCADDPRVDAQGASDQPALCIAVWREFCAPLIGEHPLVAALSNRDSLPVGKLLHRFPGDNRDTLLPLARRPRSIHRITRREHRRRRGDTQRHTARHLGESLLPHALRLLRTACDQSRRRQVRHRVHYLPDPHVHRPVIGPQNRRRARIRIRPQPREQPRSRRDERHRDHPEDRRTTPCRQWIMNHPDIPVNEPVLHAPAHETVPRNLRTRRRQQPARLLCLPRNGMSVLSHVDAPVD